MLCEDFFFFLHMAYFDYPVVESDTRCDRKCSAYLKGCEPFIMTDGFLFIYWKTPEIFASKVSLRKTNFWSSVDCWEAPDFGLSVLIIANNRGVRKYKPPQLLTHADFHHFIAPQWQPNMRKTSAREDVQTQLRETYHTEMTLRKAWSCELESGTAQPLQPHLNIGMLNWLSLTWAPPTRSETSGINTRSGAT